jgi:hypothetical protein
MHTFICVYEIIYVFMCTSHLIGLSQASVAHTCNPCYSGGRDEEDHSWNPDGANSPWDPISKKPTTQKKG